MRRSRMKQRCKYFRHIIAVPRQCDLSALNRFVQDLQRFASDEIMIELDERAVAEFVGVKVIVFDFFDTKLPPSEPVAS